MNGSDQNQFKENWVSIVSRNIIKTSDLNVDMVKIKVVETENLL